MGTISFGLDASHWQGFGINLATAKKAGFTWSVFKATEGANYTDPTFSGNVRKAIAARMATGGYHFLSAGNGSAQASRFFSVMRSSLGGIEGKLCVLDVEAGSWADVQEFVGTWRKLTKHPLIIYTGNWYWVGHLGNPNAQHLGCPLWLSRYVLGSGYASTLYARVPSSWWHPNYGGWADSIALQFADHAVLTGVTGAGDADAYRGDVGTLMRKWAYSVPPKATKPAPPKLIPKPSVPVPPAPHVIHGARSRSLGGKQIAYCSQIGVPQGLIVVATNTAGWMYVRRYFDGKWMEPGFVLKSTDKIVNAKDQPVPFTATCRPGTSVLDLTYVGPHGDIRQMYSGDYGHTWRS